MRTRVLIVLARKVCRDGLRQILADRLDIEIVGEAEDGRHAVEMVQALHPDVVIMELAVPDLNGVDATRQMVAAQPGLAVIAVSVITDWPSVMRALHAGAMAYVVTSGGFDELEHAVRAAMEGHAYLSPTVETQVVKFIDHAASEATVGNLTPREREVLQLIAEGKSTKQAADILHVSVKTVETHRRQVMSKLGIYSVAELTKFAIRQGLTSLND